MSDTEEERRIIRQGEQLMRMTELVERVNRRYKTLYDDMQRDFAALGVKMYEAGVPIEQARDAYRSLEGNLNAHADWAFTHAYLKARSDAGTQESQ